MSKLYTYIITLQYLYQFRTADTLIVLYTRCIITNNTNVRKRYNNIIIALYKILYYVYYAKKSLTLYIIYTHINFAGTKI